jgi:hypothetical protein
MTAGSLAAHTLAYRIVEPGSAQRATELAATGHGYLAYAPAALAGCVALLIAALAGHTVQSVRRHPPARVPWQIALVPLLGFAVQEHLERVLANGGAPVAAVFEPAFLVGLALQLPFALAALMLARALLRTAERIGQSLARPPAPALRSAPDIRFSAALPLLRVRPLAFGTSGRGPPPSR